MKFYDMSSPSTGLNKAQMEYLEHRKEPVNARPFNILLIGLTITLITIFLMSFNALANNPDNFTAHPYIILDSAVDRLRSYLTC
jgi:hypothetical protein